MDERWKGCFQGERPDTPDNFALIDRYIHQNISMRFLTCEPNLRQEANYTDEAEVFFSDPVTWLQREFPENSRDSPNNNEQRRDIPNAAQDGQPQMVKQDFAGKHSRMQETKNNEDGRQMPTHLVMFNPLEVTLGEYLSDNGYFRCAKFFHSHVEEGRVGSHVVVYCRKLQQNLRRDKMAARGA